jgi:hypothetical protein
VKMHVMRQQAQNYLQSTFLQRTICQRGSWDCGQSCQDHSAGHMLC